MERRESPNFDPEETEPSRSPWQNIDFMLATFPFGKVYLHGMEDYPTRQEPNGRARFRLDPEKAIDKVAEKADAIRGYTQFLGIEIGFVIGAYAVRGVLGIWSLGVRAWRLVRPEDYKL